jgi:hypothetical protein
MRMVPCSSARARVSRSWLYGQQDLRADIQRLRALSGCAPASPPIPVRQRTSEASLRRRLEAAAAELGRLREENRQLRERLAWTLGELRATGSHGQASHPQTATRTRPEGSKTIGPCS